MRWYLVLAQRLRTLFRPNRVERELDDELRFHFERQAESLLEKGHTPAEARRLARLDMGGFEQWREECRDVHEWHAWTLLRGAVRDALRAIRRRPAAALVTVTTLAVGLGSGATVLALVDVLMLRPPSGIVDPDRVVVAPARNYVVYQALRATAATVDLAAYARTAPLTLGGGADAIAVTLECVTPSYFDVLGTPLVAGRGFDDRDTALDTDLTIILAHHFWHGRFAGDPGVVGRTVQIARRTYTIIGIAPADFRGVDAEPVDGWIVLEASPMTCSFTGRDLMFSKGSSWLWTFARLKHGIDRQQAAAEFEVLLRGIDDGPRAAPSTVTLPTVREQTAERLAGDRRLSLWLMGGGLVLLLTACANAAGLMAIRAIDRRREFAVRRQLGASRNRIMSQIMTESLVLGAASGAAAAVVALVLDRSLRNFFPFAPDAGLVSTRSLLVVATLAVVASLATGVPPALTAARAHTIVAAGTIGARSLRSRQALLVVQVTVALILAVGAGLFMRSVANARTGLGYDTDRVVVASVDFERAGYRRQAQVAEFFDSLVGRAHDIPVVERIATARTGPLGVSNSGSVRSVVTRLDARPSGPIEDRINAVSPDYFATLGTRILHGRSFLESDDREAPAVMIVDEATATRLWPGENPLGQCAYIFPRPQCFQIVGIAEVRRHVSLTREAAEFFVPAPQLEAIAGSEALPRHLFLRLATGSDEEVAAAAAALRSTRPDMPFVDVQRLDDLVDTRARQWRLGAALFGMFGGVALGLAAVGIFATLSFLIRQRTAEIGLRMALGATQTHIVRTVAQPVATVLTFGLLIGGVVAWFAGRFIQASLFGVDPTDVRSFVTAGLVLAMVGAAATVVPCLRARRVDPVAALRSE